MRQTTACAALRKSGGSWLEQPRSKVLEGVVWRGIAQVVSRHIPSASDGRPDFQSFPVFRVRDPETGASTFAPWPEVQTLRVLVGSIEPSTTQARSVQYRLRAGDGSYDTTAALEEATPASSHHVAVDFEGVPLDARLTLSVGSDGRWAYNVIENVVAAALPGNWTSGSQCKELPAPVAPPDPDEPEELDEGEDNANPWLEGDESLFEELVFF